MAARVRFSVAALGAATLLLGGAGAIAASGEDANGVPLLVSADNDFVTAPTQPAGILGVAKFGIGDAVDLAGRLSPRGSLAADDGLLLALSEPNSSATALWGAGQFAAATIPLSGDLDLQFGEAMASDHPQDFTPSLSNLAQLETGRTSNWDRGEMALAGADWNFAPHAGLGIFASYSERQDDVLEKRLSMATPSSATAIGVAAHFGSGWVTTFSYNEDVTQLDLRPNGVEVPDQARSDSGYGLTIAKHGLFGADALGFTVSRPSDGDTVALQLMPFEGVGNPVEGRASLSGQAPETDLELGYVTTFLDGALALQANAGYQMNLAGQNGANAISVLSRAKINF